MPDWTGWTESTELCVTCPVCAFTFDSIHTSAEGYVCPACAELELERTIATLRALVEAKEDALKLSLGYIKVYVEEGTPALEFTLNEGYRAIALTEDDMQAKE